MFIFFMIFLSGFFAGAQPDGMLNVEPEFRQTPIWFWHGPKLACVPAPSHDIIARIAPRTILERKISEKKFPCVIAVDDLRLEARLKCGKRVLEVYYAREVMCREAEAPPRTAKAGKTK